MSDRGAVATARAVRDRLVDDIRRGDLADILRLPQLQLPDREAAVRETGAALERLPDHELAVLAEAIRTLPRRMAAMEPIKVPHDSPIPDRVIDAVPFLERERRGSTLVPTIAVVSIVAFIALGIAMTLRRAAMRGDGVRVGEEWDEMTVTATTVSVGTRSDPPGDGAPEAYGAGGSASAIGTGAMDDAGAAWTNGGAGTEGGMDGPVPPMRTESGTTSIEADASTADAGAGLQPWESERSAGA